MTVLNILQEGEPVLRQVAAECDPLDPATDQLAHDMIETLRAARGAGLAAPQVNASVRLIVLAWGAKGPYVAMCNPVIVRRAGGEGRKVEGCLSVSGGRQFIATKRAEKVWVQYTGPLESGRRTVKLKGIMAVAAQHEIDHLDGKLILDFMP